MSRESRVRCQQMSVWTLTDFFLNVNKCLLRIQQKSSSVSKYVFLRVNKCFLWIQQMSSQVSTSVTCPLGCLHVNTCLLGLKQSYWLLKSFPCQINECRQRQARFSYSHHKDITTKSTFWHPNASEVMDIMESRIWGEQRSWHFVKVRVDGHDPDVVSLDFFCGEIASFISLIIPSRHHRSFCECVYFAVLSCIFKTLFHSEQVCLYSSNLHDNRWIET